MYVNKWQEQHNKIMCMVKQSERNIVDAILHYKCKIMMYKEINLNKWTVR